MKGSKPQNPPTPSPPQALPSQKCCPCNSNTSPLPPPCCPQLGDTPVLEAQSWACSVTSSWTTFHWVTAPNAEMTRTLGMLPRGQVPAPLSPGALLGSSPPRGPLVLWLGSCPVFCSPCNKSSVPLGSPCQSLAQDANICIARLTLPGLTPASP